MNDQIARQQQALDKIRRDYTNATTVGQKQAIARVGKVAKTRLDTLLKNETSWSETVKNGEEVFL